MKCVWGYSFGYDYDYEDQRIVGSVRHGEAPVVFLVRERLHPMKTDEVTVIVRGYDGHLWLPHPDHRATPKRYGQVELRTDGVPHLLVDGRVWAQTKIPHYVVDAYGIQSQWGGGGARPDRLVFHYSSFDAAVDAAIYMLQDDESMDTEIYEAYPHYFDVIEQVTPFKRRDDGIR